MARVGAGHTSHFHILAKQNGTGQHRRTLGGACIRRGMLVANKGYLPIERLLVGRRSAVNLG